tara:strand:+ start:4691 stop:5020 length:330 start_codon:yes stop_codon:yes gene_type:complete
MKTYLVFKTDGSLYEKETLSTRFNIREFIDYKMYKTYNNYIVLYNENENELNITKLFFTTDKFKGNIAVLKIKNENITNFKLKKYLKLCIKIYKPDKDCMYYTSESDSE